MADCPFTISVPAKLAKGESGTFQLTPTPDGAVCSVKWTVNGRPAKAGDNYGDVHVVQVGFNEIKIRAEEDDPGAVIGATVECKGAVPCGPTPLVAVIGQPPGEGIKGGTIVFLVLLPFIIVIGVALLPVFVIAFIVEKATESDETKKVKKAGAEILKLLPGKHARTTERRGGGS